jgi:vacuolar-type H+-ATPase subunit C/Vma6
MIDSTSWCYSSGVVAVLETFLLAPETIRDISDADDLLARARRSPVYADLRTNDPMHAAAALETALAGYVRKFAKDCPTPHAADALLVEYDLRDVTNYLKSVHCGIERRPVELSTLPEDAMAEAIAGRPALAELAERATGAAETGESVRPEIVDLAADGAYLALVPPLTEPLGSPVVSKWAAERQRLGAVETVLRARMASIDSADVHEHVLSRLPDLAELGAMADAEPDGLRRALAELVPAELLGDFEPSQGARAVQALANRFDGALESILESSRHDAFGAGRVFGYLWHLFRENRNLRTALGGFAGRIESELVAEGLRGV